MFESKLISGSVYFNREVDVISGLVSDYLKIGIVKNEREVAQRLKEHQTGNPRKIISVAELQSPMVTVAENFLHSWFSQLRVKGEWFQINQHSVEQDVLRTAEKLIAEQQDSIEDFSRWSELGKEGSNETIREPNEEERDLHEALLIAEHKLILEKAKQDIVAGKIYESTNFTSGIKDVLDRTVFKINEKFRKRDFKETYPDIFKNYLVMQQSETKGTIKLHNKQTLSTIDSHLHLKKQNSATSSDISTNISWELAERTELIEVLHTQYLENLKMVSEAEWLVERLRAKLARMIGRDKGLNDVAIWVREKKTSEKFNEEAFKEDHPDLHATFLQPARQSSRITISTSRPYA
ncbi:GIY-YIG nuclease family protein [Gammaproteobacteria bacterium]|nr:GIY-YIG nuclease family protein [Gammaproteobacteria bacterium]